MSEPVENAQELVQLEHLGKLMEYFKEPGQVEWTEDAKKQLRALYEIALEEDPDYPVQWVEDFNRSHPHNVEIGAEVTRLGKILAFAQLYKKNSKQKEDRSRGIKQVYRDF